MLNVVPNNVKYYFSQLTTTVVDLQVFTTVHSPIPDGQTDVVDAGLLEDLVDLLLVEAGNVLPVDLQDLVAEAEAAHGRGAAFGHQGHEDTLVDGLDAEADLAILVLAKDHLKGQKKKSMKKID